jgi:hypothetical protein
MRDLKKVNIYIFIMAKTKRRKYAKGFTRGFLGNKNITNKTKVKTTNSNSSVKKTQNYFYDKLPPDLQEEIIRQSQESVEKDFQDNLKNTYEIVADIYKFRNNVLDMYNNDDYAFDYAYPILIDNLESIENKISKLPFQKRLNHIYTKLKVIENQLDEEYSARRIASEIDDLGNLLRDIDKHSIYASKKTKRRKRKKRKKSRNH